MVQIQSNNKDMNRFHLNSNEKICALNQNIDCLCNQVLCKYI